MTQGKNKMERTKTEDKTLTMLLEELSVSTNQNNSCLLAIILPARQEHLLF